ncbi:ATP-binding protein [Aestuariivivens sediminis]|uniref:hybrid sensor histidine kinase/response regulator transcription factor n=1 Tax=Aestuariivivens sediminis TaxID=2913557 RepID=UPI001F57AE0E|nr:ATP-binding protein [Aestuariivivens sediminis]
MKRLTGKMMIAWIDRLLADPRLKPEALLRKRWTWLYMIVNFIGLTCMTILGFVWEIWPILWFGYALMISQIIAIPLFRISKRFDLVLNISYGIIVILAFAVMLQTGGLTTSMGFVFIGINCAMGSVLAGNLRWTIGMFALYCTTIIILGLLQPYLVTPDYITPEVNSFYFVTDAVWVNACVLFLVILFMKDKSQYEKSEAEKLRKIDEAKTQLYTNVSHEFRTPLTIISGIADQMDQNKNNWLQSGPHKIKVQSQILLRLVNQMLDISKIEAGSMQLNLIHGDIKKFLQYVLGTFNSLAEYRTIELEININNDALYADYDPEKLMHVLGNLISNSLKFTAPGGKINVRVLEDTNRDQEMVRIFVRDNGKGIPQSAIGHIFDRFYQVPDEYHQIHGTGLGLTLTKELIKLMKGDIIVKSTVGVGTEFIISLPITREARKEKDHGVSKLHSDLIHTIIPITKRTRDHKINPKISLEKPILLIVEDHKDVVEYLIAILEDYYIIEVAQNGKLGLEKTLEIIPDVILSDVMMPEMDGFEMIRHIKNDLRTDHIPIVVLTAKGDFQSKLSGLEIGADHYLVKPFSEKELLLKLNNLLEARHKMQKKLGSISSLSHQGNAHYKQEMLFMNRINTLLDKELQNENFGIKDICMHLNMSRPQLYRKFSALTDNSIGRYIRSYRLHRAKEMIEGQNKNVTEAAMDSGFKNLSHFSTIFQEEFGYSPSKLL